MNKNFRKLRSLFSITILLFISFSLIATFKNNNVSISKPEITTTVTYDDPQAKATNPKIHTEIISYTDTTLKFHYIIDSRGVDPYGVPYITKGWAVYPNSTSTTKMSATAKEVNMNDSIITVTKLTPNTKYSTLTLNAGFIDSKEGSTIHVKSTIATFTTYPAGYVPPVISSTSLLWLWIIIGIVLIIVLLGSGWWFLMA